MLVAKDIKKVFGRTAALQGVSLTVAPGQITALIGPNGCGKSTLLRAVALLDPPDSGTVTVDDQEYVFPPRGGKSPAPPWPKLTMVFQQLFLWPHLTIRQNLTLPLRKSGQAANGKIDALIDVLDMEEYMDRFPNQVSLGQRQRAAIARSLVLEPKYLLLDEITSALDVEQVGAVLNQLKAVREQGTGILLITHLIGFAKQAADQVVFMRSGKIEEAGGPEILTSPKSENLNKFLSLIEARV
ncbi:MAG: amino acid ABC transporter ATP-binding protein [Armatimonadota bacterium]